MPLHKTTQSWVLPLPKANPDMYKTILLACHTKTTVIAIWNAPAENTLTWCRKFIEQSLFVVSCRGWTQKVGAHNVCNNTFLSLL